MKGIKEFNQKVFELFYLYRQRATLMADGFVKALPCYMPVGQLPTKPPVSKAVSQESVQREIRLRERILFRAFSSTGTYPEHPFAKLSDKVGLDRFDQIMLVCLLGQVLKDSMLNRAILPSPNFRENAELISLVFPNPSLALARTELFSNEGRLVKCGLLEIRSPFPDKFSCEFFLNPEAAKWLLGFSKQEPSIIQDCCSCNRSQGELLELEHPRLGLDQVVLAKNLREQITQSIYFFQAPEACDFLPKLGVSQGGQAILGLFYGPPGTGKTYTASAIAGELKKPLARVQFAALRNMWYGNTEKNMVRCFRTAAAKDMVLLFDEADALISARTMGNGTATDMAEHTIRNLFLQEIERFNGVVILTTNLAECLDPALERRLNLKLEFPVPDVEEREKLWRKFLKKAPCADDVNFKELAKSAPLSGGHIKNAAFSALRQLAYLRKDHSEGFLNQSMLLDISSKEYRSINAMSNIKIVGFSSQF